MQGGSSVGSFLFGSFEEERMEEMMTEPGVTYSSSVGV